MTDEPPPGGNSEEKVAASEKAREFTELLAANRRRIFGGIFALVLNMDNTEDLYQQTALVLWEKFDLYESGTDFGAWALRVARLTVYNFIRSKKRNRVFCSEPLMEKILDTHIAVGSQAMMDRTVALRKCLQRLAPSDRRLVTRCYNGQTKFKDVASEEGRSVNAIYLALSRIRSELYRCIKHRLRMEMD